MNLFWWTVTYIDSFFHPFSHLCLACYNTGHRLSLPKLFQLVLMRRLLLCYCRFVHVFFMSDLFLSYFGAFLPLLFQDGGQRQRGRGGDEESCWVWTYGHCYGLGQSLYGMQYQVSHQSPILCQTLICWWLTSRQMVSNGLISYTSIAEKRLFHYYWKSTKDLTCLVIPDVTPFSFNNSNHLRFLVCHIIAGSEEVKFIWDITGRGLSKITVWVFALPLKDFLFSSWQPLTPCNTIPSPHLCSSVSSCLLLHPSHWAPSLRAPEGCRRCFCPSSDTLCFCDLYLCTATSLALSSPLCVFLSHSLLPPCSSCSLSISFWRASTHIHLQTRWHKDMCVHIHTRNSPKPHWL